MRVFADSGLVIEFLEVLHCEGAIVGQKRSRLADRVNVTHVANRWTHSLILMLDDVVDLFIGRVGTRYEVLLVEVGVVGTSCFIDVLPKPLNLHWGMLRSLRALLATLRIIIIRQLRLSSPSIKMHHHSSEAAGCSLLQAKPTIIASNIHMATHR